MYAQYPTIPTSAPMMMERNARPICPRLKPKKPKYTIGKASKKE
jgi:hypothetical protein